jgi:hypothetical protein
MGLHVLTADEEITLSGERDRLIGRHAGATDRQPERCRHREHCRDAAYNAWRMPMDLPRETQR